ncbi:alpha-D-ribose 1-methylphosphonate 5-triphosphate synthase subunit PhnI [Glaciihabitans tibetensis]|uniref:Alpha-D-ribose 1-methylphosphonate 5-triphosphate synthase subunit PhnI n=1 Tax=Glaciihabitans tibetensis TaxID=1266600 RepID=A0A2T0VEL7_9MICO|nr:carbon-phosphorus lyase complex subunit PhnI [Glaciihabitans tibetensis]PRY68619.1 alpha-D-ribose 1-methylphosphonate 5-triphosphate synthase subunit PhnI [Glaciihabitans tibetensis]
MYVAVKGGEKAIANAHALLAKRGRGGADAPRIDYVQMRDQMGVLVARVMAEGSLYDPDLAAKALLQAQGDVLEAVTLLRSYRTTLPRFGVTIAVDTAGLPSERRVSATFKDIPGGQQLGATFDYTHRLLAEELETPEVPTPDAPEAEPMPRVTDLLGVDGLIERDRPAEGWTDPDPGDLTREPTVFPMSRAERLQALSRGDEGFLLSLGYSTQRGFGNTHPFVGEVRVGEVEVEFDAPEIGYAVPIGRIELTECQMVNQFVGSADQAPQFTRGYGLVFGRAERKAMSMSLVDRALRREEFDERAVSPAQDEEFVIAHSDNVQAAGFVEHLKLPHYVDFQAELGLIRKLRREFQERQAAAVPSPASSNDRDSSTGYSSNSNSNSNPIEEHV